MAFTENNLAAGRARMGVVQFGGAGVSRGEPHSKWRTESCSATHAAATGRSARKTEPPANAGTSCEGIYSALPGGGEGVKRVPDGRGQGVCWLGKGTAAVRGCHRLPPLHKTRSVDAVDVTLTRLSLTRKMPPATQRPSHPNTTSTANACDQRMDGWWGWAGRYRARARAPLVVQPSWCAAGTRLVAQPSWRDAS
jgi:hypothetical protein